MKGFMDQLTRGLHMAADLLDGAQWRTDRADLPKSPESPCLVCLVDDLIPLELAYDIGMYSPQSGWLLQSHPNERVDVVAWVEIRLLLPIPQGGR